MSCQKNASPHYESSCPLDRVLTYTNLLIKFASFSYQTFVIFSDSIFVYLTTPFSIDLLQVFVFLILPKVKVGVLRPVQQPGSYWDRSSELPLVGLEPTEVTAYD